MKGRRHTPEQVVRKLHEADKLIGQGKDLAAVLKHLEVSEQTYYRWRRRYGELSPDDAKRLRELEGENRRLKKIVADQAMDIDMLKEISRETSEPRATPARRFDVPAPFRGIRAKGMPSRGSGPLYAATARPHPAAGRRAAQGADAPDREVSTPVGLPADEDRAHQGRVEREHQEDPSPVARGGTAGQTPPAQTPPRAQHDR